jgi:hypothetical protein
LLFIHEISIIKEEILKYQEGSIMVHRGHLVVGFLGNLKGKDFKEN